MSMAVTPTNYNLLRYIEVVLRYRSIKFTVRKRVSASNPNFRCTSMSQSIRISRIEGLMSF